MWNLTQVFIDDVRTKKIRVCEKKQNIQFLRYEGYPRDIYFDESTYFLQRQSSKNNILISQKVVI